MKRKDVFEKIANDIVKLINQQLTDNDNVASGDLRNSTGYKIAGNRIDFSMLYYSEYVENGTKPHMPPIAPIKRWTQLKNINISPWAIAYKIKKFGTKKHPFLFIIDTYNVENELDKYFKYLSEEYYKKLKNNK